MKFFAWFLSLFVFLTFQSCVSSKKYNDLFLLKDHYKSEAEQLGRVEQQNDSLISRLEETTGQLDEAQNQLSNLSGKFLNLEGNQQTLAKEYAALQVEKKQLEKKMEEQQESCRQQIALKYREIQKKNTEIERLKVIVADTFGSPDSLLAELSQRDLQLNDLNKLLSKREQQMGVLRAKLSGITSRFPKADLSVSQKEGKLYLILSQNLLFSSNQNQLAQKGRNALWQIAEVVKNLPDIDILVEGHTDSRGGINVNWDISTVRATAVAKALASFGIAPERITPAGRSLLDPIADNISPEGKTMNRRTEIIFVPATDELYQLLD